MYDWAFFGSFIAWKLSDSMISASAVTVKWKIESVDRAL